jgi:phenylpyruvate tautomerase PptA (4-oxalocrotonate tautomerase family)
MRLLQSEVKMPILDIEIVLRPGEILPDRLAGTLENAAGRSMGSAPGRTWVKLRGMEARDYAEDGDGKPEGVCPVFVRVLKADRPEGAEHRAEVRRLTEAVASASGRPPENVHILYEASARGRLSFGGEVVSG